MFYAYLWIMKNKTGFFWIGFNNDNSAVGYLIILKYNSANSQLINR